MNAGVKRVVGLALECDEAGLVLLAIGQIVEIAPRGGNFRSRQNIGADPVERSPIAALAVCRHHLRPRRPVEVVVMITPFRDPGEIAPAAAVRQRRPDVLGPRIGPHVAVLVQHAAVPRRQPSMRSGRSRPTTQSCAPLARAIMRSTSDGRPRIRWRGTRAFRSSQNIRLA